MRTSGLIVFFIFISLQLAALIFAAPSAPAPANYADVKEWRGYYRITIEGEESDSGAEKGLPWSTSARIKRSCEGSFKLDHSSINMMAPWVAGNPGAAAKLQQEILRQAMAGGKNGAGNAPSDPGPARQWYNLFTTADTYP